MSSGTLIIGGGQAGLSCAAELRRRGHAGPVTILAGESVAPYQRPPLSKGYLSGETPLDRLWLKPEAFYAASRIDLRPGVRAAAINRAARCVVTDGGERLPYDALVLATGGTARHLPIPGARLAGVHVLRTLAEADALSAALSESRRLVVIGAGYIGLEVAAASRKRGKEVVVLEAADRPMSRTASPLLSGWFGAIHRGYGVDLRVGTAVTAIEGEGRVEAVRCGAETIPADLVLVAAGLTPDDSLARQAGLDCGDGVIVDNRARTSDPAIFAVGDVANLPSARYGRRLRLESVQNAVDQAKAAAAEICGEGADYDPVPWFWSDQYELKLQIAGLIEGADTLVRRGDPEEGRFALFHYRQGRLVACEAVNAAPEYMAAQRLIARGLSPDPERVRDQSVAMKDFLS